MRRALSITGWVGLVLFGGPVLAATSSGVTVAAWAVLAVSALGVVGAFRGPRSLTADQTLIFFAAMATGLYWLASAYYGPSLVWVFGWSVVALFTGIWWLILHHESGSKSRNGVKWWTAPALMDSFITAGIVKAPKDDQDRPMLLVKVAKDDYGVTVRVKLPAGVVFSTVEGKREALAAALGQPTHLVSVTQAKSDPANTATIRVTLPFDRTIREHALPEVTSWADPIVIARDRRNRDVTIPTYNIGQMLVGGRTGAGKTRLLWLIAAHFALDPECTLYVVDGKGSVNDWGPLRHRCERLVFVNDPAPGARFMELVTEVQDLVTERNGKAGRDWPGVLVILEEFSSMLATMDTKARKDTERAVTRLVQTCRSANVLVVIAAQRPAASVMSTDTRAQAGVSVALAMKGATDTTMVLGHTPTLDLPSEPGEAIVVVPGREDVFVDLDYLEDAAWAELCASLPARKVEDAWLPEDEPAVPTRRTVAVTYDPPTVAPVPDDAPVVEPSPRNAVLTFLGGVESGRPGEIVDATGFAQRTVELALSGLVKSGDVVRVGRGLYSLPGCVTTSEGVR